MSVIGFSVGTQGTLRTLHLLPHCHTTPLAKWEGNSLSLSWGLVLTASSSLSLGLSLDVTEECLPQLVETEVIVCYGMAPHSVLRDLINFSQAYACPHSICCSLSW